MDNKEAIMQAAIDLIKEKGDRMDEITVRDICKRAGVGLGLVNYHFESKDNLIELCVERIVNGVVDRFRSIREKTEGLTPFEKLDCLGSMTLTFLFEHYAVAKISILADMKTPKGEDNTQRTYLAYLPLVSACRPEWDKATVEYKTFCLIAIMQQVFLRHEALLHTQGIDLTDPAVRKSFHTQILHDILGV